MDYKETFTPVAKIPTNSRYIVITSVLWWCLSQIDVKNAFLNGDLQEEVYMVSSPSISYQPGEIFKFRKPSATSNRYLELDLRIFLPWLLYLFFILAAMIQLYFIDVHSSIFFCSLYTLMTQLLLMMMMELQHLSQS